MFRLHLIPSVIITSCCVHNFIIQVHGVDDDDDDCVGSEEEEDGIFPLDHVRHIGHIQRKRIASLLSPSSINFLQQINVHTVLTMSLFYKKSFYLFKDTSWKISSTPKQ